MNKKIGVGIFSLLFVSILLINLGFISAGPLTDKIVGGLEGLKTLIIAIWTKFLIPLTGVLFNAENPAETIPKLLFFIIILGIIHFALKNIPFFQNKNNFLYGLIVFAIAFLSTYWLSGTNLIETILMPYSVLGIAIASGLPFLTYFLILNMGFTGAQYRIVRVGGWILFGVIYLVLWYSRGGVLEPSYALSPGVVPVAWLAPLTGAAINPIPAGLTNFSWIYLLTAFLSFGMALFDRKIQGAWQNSKTKLAFSKVTARTARALQMELSQLYDAVGHGTPVTGWEARVAEIKNELKRLGMDNL